LDYGINYMECQTKNKKKGTNTMKKRIFSFVVAVCLCVSLCVVAGAISYATSGYISMSYHLIPILNDSATGVPGSPYWGSYYNVNSLYSRATVTAYNNSTSNTATTNCYNPTYVLESWYTYTKATASINSIKSATATLLIGGDTGTATQYASISR
jgi:hypothetical protein